MALTRDKIIEAIAAGSRIPIYKGSMGNMAAGYLCALWRAAGSPSWLQGAIPGAAATLNDNTVGGIILPAFSGKIGRIYRFAPLGTTIGTFMLYDRLAHMGGLVGNLATAQTVNLAIATALSEGRCAEDISNVEWFIEVYTDVGTTAANGTVTYTDRNDASGKTITLPGLFGTSPLNRAGRCVPIIPTDNVPIKSVQSVTLSVSTGTAGSFGVTARKLLCEVPQLIANITSPVIDAVSIGMPEIKETSCLEMLVQCSTTSTGVLLGSLNYGLVVE